MRKLFLLMLLSVLAVSVVAAQNYIFKPEDNIIEFCKEKRPKFMTAGPQLIAGMPETVQNFLKFKEKTTDADTKILESENFIVGVLQNNDGKNEILYDMDGDGILDVYSERMFVPAWVLFRLDSANKTPKNNTDAYLDSFYELFNANENPYTSGRLNGFLTRMIKDLANERLENRDIIYGIFLYYALQKQKNTYLNFSNMQMVLNEYLDRFHQEIAHPLLFLWIIEEYIPLGEKDKACSITEDAKDEYPDFIPFKVYSWQLEKDPEIKKEKYKELKKNYPKHWIIA